MAQFEIGDEVRGTVCMGDLFGKKVLSATVLVASDSSRSVRVKANRLEIVHWIGETPMIYSRDHAGDEEVLDMVNFLNNVEKV